MISVSGKKWIEQKVNKNSVEKIKQDFNFNDILARLIVLRNYDITEINSINNNLKLINVLKDNSDFIHASEILINSINKKDNICILGDYDVDGISSTSLLIRFFKHIKQQYFYYIPDREKDGYGATTKLFQKLISKKPKLVIMVDCGSNSNEAIDYLVENGYDSKMGARPMQRLIDDKIKQPLSKELLFGKLKQGGEVKVTANDKGLVLDIPDNVKLLEKQA